MIISVMPFKASRITCKCIFLIVIELLSCIDMHDLLLEFHYFILQFLQIRTYPCTSFTWLIMRFEQILLVLLLLLLLFGLLLLILHHAFSLKCHFWIQILRESIIVCLSEFLWKIRVIIIFRRRHAIWSLVQDRNIQRTLKDRRCSTSLKVMIIQDIIIIVVVVVAISCWLQATS